MQPGHQRYFMSSQPAQVILVAPCLVILQENVETGKTFCQAQYSLTISFASSSTLSDPLCLLLIDEFSLTAAVITFQDSLLSINQLEVV